MSRKKKTLKQKKQTDVKKSAAPSPSPESQAISYTYERVNTPSPMSVSPAKVASNTINTVHELKMSLLMTLVLVAINTIIFILYKSNIISFSVFGIS